MLTNSEKAWLKRRQFFNGFYSSGCLTCSLNRTFCEKTDCPLHPDLEDALEFSERVAAELASWETLPVPCMNDIVCNRSSLECASCRIKWARLTVEEEMDGYNTM